MLAGILFTLSLTFVASGIGLVTSATLSFEFWLARAFFAASAVTLIASFFSWRKSYREKAIFSSWLIWLAGAVEIPAALAIGVGGIAWVGLREAAVPPLTPPASVLSSDISLGLPLTIGKLPDVDYQRYSGLYLRQPDGTEYDLKTMEQDPPLYILYPVQISNNSLDHAMTLTFCLLQQDPNGHVNRISGSGLDGLGRKMGVNDMGTILMTKHHLEKPKYILSPLELPPQHTAFGELVFILPYISAPKDIADKQLSYWAGGIIGPVENRFKFSIELTDAISSKSVVISLPSDGYHGPINPTGLPLSTPTQPQPPAKTSPQTSPVKACW